MPLDRPMDSETRAATRADSQKHLLLSPHECIGQKSLNFLFTTNMAQAQKVTKFHEPHKPFLHLPTLAPIPSASLRTSRTAAKGCLRAFAPERPKGVASATCQGKSTHLKFEVFGQVFRSVFPFRTPNNWRRTMRLRTCHSVCPSRKQ